MDQRLIHISKEISYALRHHPEEFGLAPDEQGFVPVDTLLAALNARHPGRRPVTRADLEQIIATSPKQRHQISGDRIRALYGHSFAARIDHAPATPPDVLYHGTARRALASIRRQGLLPMERQYVHLSTNVAMAREVGARRDEHPAILLVDAKAAASDGVRFYLGNNDVWLADSVPPQYLTLLTGPDYSQSQD